MAIQLKWPLLGVAIPCAIIAFLGYGGHYLLFYTEPKSAQITHQVLLTMVWVTYALAIFKSPGRPPKDYKPPPGQWKRWCQKCHVYKSPRTHHCKTCQKCVMVMDHHCPWTYNCVGHGNLPEFLRFLVSVMLATGHVLWLLGGRIRGYYVARNQPAYLISKWSMFWVLVFTLTDFAVFASIALLYIRCLINIFAGRSQIEQWEWQRFESQFHTERMWLQIRKNYRKMHGTDLPKLESCRFPLRDDPGHIVPVNFHIDDVIFPYDYGLWQNIVVACGYPWDWVFGGSRVNGYEWPPSPYAEDDQLNLPWPPDGGHREITVTNDHEVDSLDLSNPRNVTLARRRLDKRGTLDRREWINDDGEGLGDYGVDVDGEGTDEEIVVEEIVG
ncbi:palmitoyltransferase Pfa4p [Diutina catenulata]